MGSITLWGYIKISINILKILFKFKKGLSVIFKIDYITRLKNIIYNCVKEFEYKYPYDIYSDKFPFYHSQILVERLLKYRMFGEGYIDLMKEEFIKNDKIIVPSEEILKEFLDNFINKVKNDKKLRELYIEENYKNEIFNIRNILSNKLDKIDKTINELSKESSNEYSSWLEKFFDNIKSFKPKSALENIVFIEKKIKNEQNISSKIKARLHYLKGICYKELWDTEISYIEFLEAHKLEPDNEEYFEKSVLSLLNLKDYEKVKIETEKLLKLSEYNEVARAIKVCLDENDIPKVLKQVPDFIKKSQKFKITACEILYNRKKYDDVGLILFEEREDVKVPVEIDFENKDYWAQICMFYFSVIMHKYKIFSLEHLDNNLKKSKKLLFINLISKKFEILFTNTEKINALLHYQFLYNISEYVIKGRSKCVYKLYEISKTAEKEKSFYIFHTIYCLSQIGEYDKALEIITDLNKIEEPLVYFAKYYLLYKKGKIEDSKNTFVEFLNHIKIIDEMYIIQIIEFMDTLIRTNEEREKLIEKINLLNKYGSTIDNNLLNIYLKIRRNETKSSLKNIIKETYKLLADNHRKYKLLIAIFYRFINELSESISVLNEIVDETQESQEYELLIDNLYLQKPNKDIERLLKLLKNWRENLTPKEKYLSMEIEILHFVPDWENVNVVSKYAYDKFPQSIYFFYYYTLSLQKLQKKDKLNEVLNKDIKDYEFRQEDVLHFVRIAIREGNNNMAIDLLYPFARDINNKKAREMYFNIVSIFYRREEDIKKYKKVEDGLSVKVKANNEESFIEINKISIENDIRVPKLIGKELNDIISYQTQLGEELIYLQILGIYDKYQKLYFDILDEINKVSASGMSVKTFKFDSNDTFAMTKKMIEEFGKESDFYAEQKKEILGEYYNRKISFSELCNNVFNRNILECYFYLTSNNSDGFQIDFKRLYNNLPKKDNTIFVIDITSALLFFRIDRELNIKFKDKFYISGFYRDFIEEEIFQTELEREEKYSLTITSSDVIPIFYPKDYKEKRLEYLNDLINWIDENTISRPVIEKLNIMLELQKNRNEYNVLFEANLDTAFLANVEDAILISDDSFFFRLYQRGKLITTEYFLYEYYANEVEKFVPFLLSKNYIGIQITSENLLDMFNESYGFINSNYNKALKNLPYNLIYSHKMVNEYLIFAREIYLKPTIILPQRKYIVTNFFVFYIKGIKIREPNVLKKYIFVKLDKLFNLLPSQLDSVKDDFANALRIVYG